MSNENFETPNASTQRGALAELKSFEGKLLLWFESNFPLSTKIPMPFVNINDENKNPDGENVRNIR